MSNFIYYEKLEDYEEQVRKAKLCDEKDKEIERLNKELEEKEAILGGIQQLEAEIERLNNIINELEKDMIFDINDYGKDLDIQTGNIYSEYHRGYCQNGKDYYDRLQELKGNNKDITEKSDCNYEKVGKEQNNVI